MRAVKSRGNTSTELALIKIFREQGIVGWRRGNRNLSGKPDFIFPKKKIAVFTDGCFWHGCKKCRTIPATNRVFWRKKIVENMNRDKKNNQVLKSAGWNVLRFWEHDLKYMLKE